MRILQLDTGTGWRGGQQQVLWLMEALRERGHEQLLVAPKDSPLAEAMQKQGFQVGALSLPAVSLANIRTLRGMAAGLDILHAHDSHAHSLAWLGGVGQGRRQWPRVVVSRRVAFPIGIFGVFKYATADAYIPVSDYGRRQLLQVKVPAQKIQVIHDGVKPPELPLPGTRTEFRSRYGLTEDTPVVGTFTSLAPEKLLHEQIAALAALPSSVHFWIGRPAFEPGQRAAQAALLDEARARGLEQRFQVISLAGDLGRFFCSLDVFVYLSRAEGLGSAILLAMAHGLPVVASRVGGIPEIVRQRETGLLVGENWKEELPAAIRLLLESESLRRQLGSAGRKFVLENATTELMASRTEAVYEGLLARRDISPPETRKTHPAGVLGGHT